jgi:5-methylthioribose kinase
MPTLLDLNLKAAPEIIHDLLVKHVQWDSNNPVTHIEKAGDGNMNLVVRVFLKNGSTCILKQAKPYVNKYPQIPAPLNRIDTEYQYYQAIQHVDEIRKKMPACFAYIPEYHVLILEDLGTGSDYTYLYKKGQAATFPGLNAIEYLSHLHQLPTPEPYPDNMQLRLLNAEHLFEYPYRHNDGFDLDQVQHGLQDLAEPFYHSMQLKETVQALKKSYLSVGYQLIHGDYYPGSWLDTKTGFKVIDPEFSFVGHAEYDLGVMLGHCKMARVPDEVIKALLNEYDYPVAFDQDYMWQISGMEIIRRLIGLAQLPLDLSIDEKKILLGWSLKKMM